jgi:hypothetical protein
MSHIGSGPSCNRTHGPGTKWIPRRDKEGRAISARILILELHDFVARRSKQLSLLLHDDLFATRNLIPVMNLKNPHPCQARYTTMSGGVGA